MKTTGKVILFVLTFLALTACAHAADGSPLFAAINRRDIAEVKALLANGTDVNARNDYGQTPLRSVFSGYEGPQAMKENKDIAELLLAKGADVNAKDRSGETPLHYAVIFENDDAADLLVEHMLKQARRDPRAALVQLTAELRGKLAIASTPYGQQKSILSLNDYNRRLIIKLASELKPAPAIPEEARKHFVEGTAIVKAAKNPAQQSIAAQSFTEALKIAPWWADAYYNLGAAQELAEKYNEAEQAFNFYLLSNPSEKEKREVQDRIYALSAKRKLLGAK